jgi:hypothetical protein
MCYGYYLRALFLTIIACTLTCKRAQQAHAHDSAGQTSSALALWDHMTAASSVPALHEQPTAAFAIRAQQAHMPFV